MKQLFWGVLFSLLLPALAFAGEKMEGYGKSKWGMTPSEVISVEQGRAHLINPPEKYYNNMLGLVGIDKLNIGYHDFKVVYQFTNNRLIQVIVQTIERKNAGINQMAFSNLDSLLTQKYGKPNFKEDGKSAVWNQPGTTIELSHTLIEDVVSMVTVKYTPTSRTVQSTDNL